MKSARFNPNNCANLWAVSSVTNRACSEFLSASNSEFNFPNKLIELRVPINDGRSKLIIPKDGLIADGIEKLVYIVEKNKVKRKTVTLGQSFKDQIEIKSGVNEGDLVVIKGNENIRPNQSVKIKKNKKWKTL